MKISERDWAQVSAFLDGELSSQEQARIKNRIEVDPVLSSALEDLKKLKAVLRHTPQVPLPRDFILKPAQVGIRKRAQPLYRSFQLAAAVLSFLLFGSLALDFGSLMVGGALAPMPKEVVMEAAPESADEISAEPALMAAESEIEQDQPVAETEETPLLEEVPPAPAAEMETSGDAESLAAEVGEEEKTVLEELPAEPPLAADNLAEDWQGETERGVGAEQPTSPPGDQPVQPLRGADEQPDLVQPVDFPLILRLLEVFLALGVIGFGTAAWLIRRRDRGR